LDRLYKYETGLEKLVKDKSAENAADTRSLAEIAECVNVPLIVK